MSLQNLSRLLRLQLTPQQPMQQAQHCWGNSSKLAAARRLSGVPGASTAAWRIMPSSLLVRATTFLHNTCRSVDAPVAAAAAAAAALTTTLLLLS
jgi:hypothetical protein